MAAAPFRAILCEAFGAPQVMQIATRQLPAPGPGQYLLRMSAAGVNPSDTYVRLGRDGPYAAKPELLPELPFTPGKDGAGVVVEAPATGKFKVGDRVYTDSSVSGTYAEQAICEEQSMYALPDNVTMEQGACLGVPAATAYRALFQRCGAKAGDKVFIHGASGAVGLVATQLAVDAGCTVVGTAGTEEGAAAVKQAGADTVLNHREEGYLEVATKAIGGAGFDVCLEMMASANLAKDLSIMGSRGRIGIIGSKAAGIEINPRIIMGSEIDVKGVFLYSATPEEKEEIHKGLFAALEKGALTPIVGLALPLEDAPRAHAEVMQPTTGGAAGNIVLTMH